MTRKLLSRIFSQHKVFYCYTALSLWIFILMIGLFKYLGTDTHYQSAVAPTRKVWNPQPTVDMWVSQRKFKKVFKSCSPVQSLSLGSENAIKDALFSMDGMLVVFRHGDRGPVNHVRNLNSMSCDSNDNNGTVAYNEYASFVSSQWPGQRPNSLYQYYGQPNPHFPIPTTKQCEIGQLTANGVLQHLKLGSLLRSMYFDKLFDNTSVAGNIFAYTTKYRRTFQSLSAFLYGFLGEAFHKIPLRTVSSMYFCFEDCACPAIETYGRAVIKENSKRLKSHPAMMNLVEDISSVIYTMSDGSFIKDPHYLKDALLTYICHNRPLPCWLSKCIYPEYVTRVFSYVDWDIKQYAKSVQRHRLCTLNTYGFFKNIMSHLLKIVSQEKPKMVLYSAHDKTITYLLTTLGITSVEAVSPVYASRVIFEVYSQKETNNSSMKKFFFRLLFNGKDLTHRIKFCTNNLIIASETSKISLCSFESFIRFLHDDYFSIFNSMNFKDACVPMKQ